MTGAANRIRFRSALIGDLPSLHAAIEAAYRGDTARSGWTHEADLIEAPRTSIAALEAVLCDAGEMLLIAEDDAGIVGCVQISRQPENIAYLGLLTVLPKRQAGGIGRMILAAGEDEAVRRLGARTMELSVVSRRPELIGYYERRGYVRTGERRPFPIALDPPLELVVLAKRLHLPA